MLLYNQNVPLVKHNTRDRKKTPRMPWISTSLLKSINKKNKLFYSYKVSGTDSLRKRYVNYRNTLTSVLRSAKKTHFFAKFQATSNDIKGTWKVIKNVFKSKKVTLDVKNIKIDGSCSRR